MHSEIVGQLRSLVLDGELAPGTRVPETALCQRFAASRTPLREAIKALAAEGLIELIPNRGAWIKTIDAEEIGQLFSVTGALESLAGEECCQRITDSEIDELRILHQAMQQAFVRKNLQDYYALNHRIHSSIVAATKNAVLIAVYGQINARITRIRFVTPMDPMIWTTAMQEHEGMMNAIERRDGGVLSNILKTHLRTKCAAILDGLSARPEEKQAGRSKSRMPRQIAR